MVPQRMFGMTPWVRRLIVANLIVFLLQMTIFVNPWFVATFGFAPLDALARPWTFVTYTFIHANFLHLAFNLLALFVFGPPVEERMGGGAFLAYYGLCGLGGAARCNSFTKFYLALLGQFPYANCPVVPPEMILLPTWCYFNLYAMSSWTRTIVVPLSIFSACKPVRSLPSEKGITELFIQPPETPLWPAKPTGRLLSWTNFFLGIGRARHLQ